MQLLLEIGTQELPPGEIEPALNALSAMIRDGVKSERLAIGTISTFATPRRLALLIDDVHEKAEDLEELQLGPSVAIAFDDEGQPTRAAQGFARGKGLDPAELSTVETDKGTYVAARVHEEGRPAAEILNEILPHVIGKIPWKRSMRSGWSETSFARPITWLVALLDGDVLDIEFGGHKAHRTTYGHRFLAPAPIELTYPSAYVSALRDSHVLVDINERRDAITRGLDEAAKKLGLNAIVDNALVEEVTQLVEWPVPLVGRFDERLLAVPREVLITSMKKHQRYFAFEDANGDLANAFCFVANIESDNPDIIVAGNQRVLVARLEDARFFWDEDRKRTLQSRIEDLETIRYIEGLGNVRERSQRIEKVTSWLCDTLFPNDDSLKTDATRAALLSKADLGTGMVNEFGDLQGTMGRYYASEDGENAAVAEAIEQHYRPRGATDAVAASRCAALVAIADKIDAIVGCFALGLIPSGSADPYGLRRAAIGLLRTLIEYDVELSLSRLVAVAYETLPQGKIRDAETTCDEAEQFIADRMRTLVDAPTDIVNAILAVRSDRMASLRQRAEVLNDLRSNADFEPLAAAFKRVVNILGKAEQDDDTLHERLESGTLSVKDSRLEDAAEQQLHAALKTASEKVKEAMDDADFRSAAQTLIALKSPIDAFFDDVMVNVNSAELRENRLALLHEIRELFLRFADLSLIQVS